WWVGDAIGDLLVAPFILVWATWKPRVWRHRIIESLAMIAVVIGTGILIFSGGPGDVVRGREYMLFPPLVWAALRFGIRGSVTAAALATLIAIVSTAFGRGPFVQSDLHQNLLALQTFVAICGATF